MKAKGSSAIMFEIPPSTCSSSPESTDDISLFLRQILLKSSKPMQCQSQRQQPPLSSGISIPDRIPTFSSPANPALYLSSSSVATFDNDPDDYDCESEEGFENMMEEIGAKRNPSRNPGKRTRAAEVHNLSEKRRRSRINEKMKALQKLIPNSNKTDKASMLDEAIEYLKQLQLQVQMLTMRNGINLYSMCIPPPPRIEGHESTNITTINQETLVNPMLSRSHPSQPDFSHLVNAQPSFASFQLPNSSKEFCREGMLTCPPTEISHNGPTSVEVNLGWM